MNSRSRASGTRTASEDPGREIRHYHEATKHSVEKLRSSRHFLDWPNQPIPLKVYRDLPGETLPVDPAPSGVSAIDAVLAPPEPRRDRRPDRAALARILRFSLGIVRRRELADGRTMYFRAAPCTGALYHVDAYLAVGELPDLAPGLYHFGVHDFALRKLRGGDVRGNLVEASGAEAAAAEAPVLIVLASTWWRNAWKYESRAWRHVFWDGGTILAHLLAQAAADRWPARLLAGFVDSAVERLCGLDPEREGPLAIVALGDGTPAPPAADAPPIRHETEPISRREVDYPPIREAQRASSLADAEAVRRWRAGRVAAPEPAPGDPAAPLPAPASGGDALERVILRRGSTRVFSHRPISAGALSTILAMASAPIETDYRDPARSLVDLFVIVNAVEGVAPGSYRYDSGTRGLVHIAAGDFRREAGFLGLGQEIPADAAVNVYALADLDRVLAALGNRGYRAAQLDGAISGGRVYLGAYAQRLGASGLTFFDDDVCRFFGVDPQRYGVMFLTAAGVPAKL